MHQYNHWIFDLDGTLTVAQHDFEQIRRQLGIPRGRLILEYLNELEVAQAQPLRAELDALEAALVPAAKIAEGAHELVRLLHQRGANLGILTRNTAHNARDTLRRIGLAHFFADSAVLGREEAAPKPSAAGIAELLRQWHGQRERCVMVGDFRFDLEAGRNAGVATAHIAPPSAAAWPELTDHRFASLAAVVVAIVASAANQRQISTW